MECASKFLTTSGWRRLTQLCGGKAGLGSSGRGWRGTAASLLRLERRELEVRIAGADWSATFAGEGEGAALPERRRFPGRGDAGGVMLLLSNGDEGRDRIALGDSAIVFAVSQSSKAESVGSEL